MRALMTGIGLLLVMAGVAAADSEKLWIPAVMIAVGIVMIKLSMPAKEDEDEGRI